MHTLTTARVPDIDHPCVGTKGVLSNSAADMEAVGTTGSGEGTERLSQPHRRIVTDAQSGPTTAFLLGLGPNGSRAATVASDTNHPSMWSTLSPILGRSPFQRHLRQLSSEGIKRFVVLAEGERIPAEVERVCRKQASEVLATSYELLFALAGSEEDRLGVEEHERVAMVCAGRVIDPRIYRAAFSAACAVWVGDRRGGEDDSPPEPVGIRITVGTMSQALHGPDEEVLLVGDLEPYIANLRRVLRPFWTPTADAEERERAASMLIDATQKGVLDLPARYLHPPAENFLVRVLSPTPITPNQITIFTGIIGFGAAGLFATGSNGPAILIALLVNVLDGVDGKLARVKLLASRFGDRLDHILDVLFEFSWYLGIGWGLSGGGPGGTPMRLGVGLIAIMLGARAMSGVYKRISSKQIHDHRAFDRAFRLVAGRRNIYVMTLVVGQVLGRFSEAFTLCFAWGVVTLLVYSARTAVEASGLLGGGGGRAA